MKDNDYVGVDEKYKPKTEVQSDMDKEKEENNKRVKKVGKFVIGGFLFWILLVVVIMISIIIFTFFTMNKMSGIGKEMFSKGQQKIDGIVNEIKQSQQELLDNTLEEQEETVNNSKQEAEQLVNEAQQKQQELINASQKAQQELLDLYNNKQ